MSEILIEHIGTSRYAPVDLDTYQYNGLEGLSFGQLVMAVCCRRAAAIENQSVVKMNELTASTAWLEAVSAAAQQIFTATSLDAAVDLGTSGYRCRKTTSQTPTLKDFLQNECGVNGDYITISTADERTALFGQLKATMDAASSQSQQQTIALQSLVSRRDVTYNASAATVRTLGQSSLSMAANLR